MSEDVTEDEFWRDGYDTGYTDGLAGWPNMLDVLGRPTANVIPLRPRRDRIENDVTEDEFWQDGYDTGREHGSAGMPNMLDVRGRPTAEVIPLRPRIERRTESLTAP